VAGALLPSTAGVLQKKRGASFWGGGRRFSSSGLIRSDKESGAVDEASNGEKIRVGDIFP